jgi:carboxyl-terminal processing protease
MLKSIARRAFLPLAFTAFVSLGAIADDGGKSDPAAPAATPGVAPEQNDDSNTGKAAAAAVEPIPVDDIRVLVEVLHKIKSDYVEAIDDKTLIENAMRGMLSGLDPHSAYLDADDYTDLQEGTSGEFGGLGIEVGMEEGFVKVISPIDDTPAQQAGVQAGDTIIKLDDTLVKGMSINDAVKKMRGKPGSDITLTILREGEQKPLTFKLTRALIKVASVRSRLLEPGYGYIRVSQFQAATGEDVIKQLGELKAKSGDKLNGLILDLRNNPGGLLGAAVSISDAFLDPARSSRPMAAWRIPSPRSRQAAGPAERRAGDRADQRRLGLGLGNRRRRAAGPRRARSWGTAAFGKGSVQTIMPLEPLGACGSPRALLHAQSGRSIQAEGIKPDIVIDKVKVSSIKSAGADTIKEADLSRHLANPITDKGKTAPAEPANGGKQNDGDKDDDADKGPLAERDYELYEAFNMLKGMVMLNSKRNVAAP